MLAVEVAGKAFDLAELIAIFFTGFVFSYLVSRTIYANKEEEDAYSPQKDNHAEPVRPHQNLLLGGHTLRKYRMRQKEAEWSDRGDQE